MSDLEQGYRFHEPKPFMREYENHINKLKKAVIMGKHREIEWVDDNADGTKVYNRQIVGKPKQRQETRPHETIVKWQDVNKKMPDTKHIEERTQFLLKGAYGTPGRLGATCYIVSRLDEAAYTCGDEIVFESPVGFIPEKWQHIK